MKNKDHKYITSSDFAVLGGRILNYRGSDRYIKVPGYICGNGEAMGGGIFSPKTAMPVIIGEQCFKGSGTIRSVVIEEGVCDIEEHAFEECSELSAVHVPDSVKSIPNFAFSDCTSLTSLTLPKCIKIFSSFYQGMA